MNPLWNLIKKELRELLTKSSVISVLAVVVILIAMGSFIGGEIKEVTDVQEVGYIDLSETATGQTDYAGYAVDYMKKTYASSGLDPNKYIKELNADGYGTPAFTNNVLNAMKDKSVNSVIVIVPSFNGNINSGKTGNYEVYWMQDGTGIFSSLDTVSTTTAITVLNQGISEKILSNNGVSSEVISLSSAPATYSGSTFLKGDLKENVSPDQIYSATSQQTMFVPIVMMLIIVMIGSILISSMGNEKENKTLETLLTLPINRTTIVTGKLIGSAIAGLALGAMYMVGMFFYINGMTSATMASGVTMEQLGLTLSFGDWILVVICIFLAILCALSLCMILGAFAKNYKAAQTYILPISILAIIPMVVTMFSSYGSLPAALQGVLFVIPFTHPMMVIQNLMFGDYTLVLAGIAYLIIFAVITIYITVRLYKSDILLTGLLRKKKKKTEAEE